MPSYFSPGVYIEEVSSGSKPIAGVGIATAAFVGIAEKASVPLNEARLCTNRAQFVENFGDFTEESYLAYAVYGFFAEGGTSCYVARVQHSEPKQAVLSYNGVKFQAKGKGSWGNKISVEISDPSDGKDKDTRFKLTLSRGPVQEVFDGINAEMLKDIPSNLVDISVPVFRPGNKQTQNLIGGEEGNPASFNDSRLTFQAKATGVGGNSISYSIDDPEDKELDKEIYFKLTIQDGTETPEVFKNVRIDDGVLKGNNSEPVKSERIDIKVMPSFQPFRPENTSSGVNLTGGEDKKAAVNDDAKLRVTARRQGTQGNEITYSISDPSDKKMNKDIFFDLTIKKGTEAPEIFRNVRSYNKGLVDEEFDPVVSDLVDINLVEPNKEFRPVNTEGKLNLQGGDSGAGGITKDELVGNTENCRGLHAFDTVDDINIVAIPDLARLSAPEMRAGIQDGLAYCGVRKDCFFVADCPQGLDPAGVRDFRRGRKTGGNPFNSDFGAFYYPWIKVSDPLNPKVPKLVPPSGLVAGTYAHVDSTRGVHKAPAGITDGYLDSAIGVEKVITKDEHDILNQEDINVIRSLPEGICIWGARTLSADSQWTYINVRRLFTYIERSLYKGTQWVVFEPNDPSLWSKVKRNLSSFLTRVWRDGALYGTVAEEAFFIKVDEENNPKSVRDAGQLVIEVGVAPVKPAEFVIIRVSQKVLAK